MSVINANPLMLGDAGYNIGRSLRFRSSASAYLSRTPASAGNQQKFTWSGWVKRGQLASVQRFLSAGTGGGDAKIGFLSGDTLQFQDDNTGANVITTQVFRDPSAWYHIIYAIDSTQATAANRVLLYINGVNVTAFSTATYMAQNANSYFNSANANYIGRRYSGGEQLDGYLAEVNFIDGQALTPSSFGQTDPVTGVWTPKKYTGTYGTNGFYLDFKNNTSATTLAYDKSGNGNNWTPNNISTTAGATYDSMTDVPTLTSATAANYCTLNPVFNATAISASSTAVSTISNGNLTAVCSNTTTGSNAYGTIGVTSGKWYFELTRTSGGANTDGVGFFRNAVNTEAIYRDDGNFRYNNGEYAYGASWQTNGTVIGIALDLDNTTITFYKNGVSQGAATTSLPAGTYIPYVYNRLAGTLDANFGQRPFSYTPPTGFKALNTFNLPDPTIKKPNQYMDATTYTGNGGSNSYSNLGFQPDFLWSKSRSNTAWHYLIDGVRGTTKYLNSNDTGAEGTLSTTTVTFNSNGVSYSGGESGLNANAQNYVNWCWKKGATPGFDIVTYTGNGVSGRTVAHSLGVAPAMTIIKRRDYAQFWICWHKSFASYTNNLYLNGTDSVQADGNFTALPNSTVLTLDAGKSVNVNTATYVAYLFAEIAGFSKFGSYTGNGSTDGPFVYCGFRPRFILLKDTSVASQWYINDTARNTFNLVNSALYPNLSNAEATTAGIDIVSNGFKVRTLSGDWNNNGENYIFAAFAENPFKYSNAR